MSTDADTADGGSAPRVPSRRAALRAQETRLKFWRVAAVSAFFAVVMGANLFVGGVVLVGTMKTQNNAAELEASNRTGRVSRSMIDGTFCRFTTFDNKLAHSAADRIARCDEWRPKRQSKTTFSWGKE